MDCRGPINLDASGGDLQVMDAGGAVAAKLGGDGQVSLTAAGHPVNLRCGGDIHPVHHLPHKMHWFPS